MESSVPIKIAVLLPSLQVGGAESLVYEELNYLRKDSRFFFELHVVFEKGPLWNKFASLGIPMRVWNAPHKSVRMFYSYFNIYRYLVKYKFAILHVHLLDILGPLTGKLAGIKTITTVHVDSPIARIRRWGIKQSDFIIGCGSQVFSNLHTFMTMDKLLLLNNGIPAYHRRFYDRELILKKYGIAIPSRLILSFGRLSHQKGYDILIQAFKSVVRFDRHASLIIGGEGPEKQRLERLIVESNINDSVKLVGNVEDVDELYEICDVYVNASRWEGLPMTLLEAMSHKKPIVATSVGGNNDLIANNVTGLLVNPENPTLLADSINAFLCNPALALECAKQGYDLFRAKYAIDRHCADLVNIYLNSV
ncbi:MAG: glycosyltransferase family 4 protein [Nitrospirae bacterium]|nr:glycosyltransferase family 4 protein [Nitrospirota bacterium]